MKRFLGHQGVQLKPQRQGGGSRHREKFPTFLSCDSQNELAKMDSVKCFSIVQRFTMYGAANSSSRTLLHVKERWFLA
jgi:hypothetical protein